MKGLFVLTAVLVIVGGLNWGLVGIAGLDLVAALLGEATLLSRAVYALVGVSAIYQATQVFRRDRVPARVPVNVVR